MKKSLIIIILFLTSLFAQYEIEGRWHLVGYEDLVMYQFVDTEPFADAGWRYTLYSMDGNFGDLDEAGGSPNPYSIVDDIITIDMFFGTIVNYQINFRCDGQVVEFIDIDYDAIHSILFREGYNYIDSECAENFENCCDAVEIAEDECGGLGCYIPQCTASCEWEPMQCWSSTGYCWCVDENGVEIEGSSTPSWQGYPDCEEYSEDCIDGEINNDNPCNPMECWDGEWIEIIIDCPEWFGVPCEGGVYIPPEENQCCSECVLLGDINIDFNLNVLDIISIIDIILTGGQYNIIADLDYNGNINVVDIVQLVNIILNN